VVRRPAAAERRGARRFWRPAVGRDEWGPDKSVARERANWAAWGLRDGERPEEPAWPAEVCPAGLPSRAAAGPQAAQPVGLPTSETVQQEPVERTGPGRCARLPGAAEARELRGAGERWPPERVGAVRKESVPAWGTWPPDRGSVWPPEALAVPASPRQRAARVELGPARRAADEPAGPSPEAGAPAPPDVSLPLPRASLRLRRPERPSARAPVLPARGGSVWSRTLVAERRAAAFRGPRQAPPLPASLGRTARAA